MNCSILTWPSQSIVCFCCYCVGICTLPYTLSLLFIQCLKKVSHYRVLFWVVKLKPLFDAYTGPYKDKFSFWTGFLLVIRITLFIAIASNTTKGPILNLSLVCVTAAILLLLCQAGVYKAWPVSIIESFTYFNLIIFSMGMAYVLQLTSKLTISHHKDRAVILCVGSMFLLFCGIVAYTIVRMLVSTVWWGRTKLWLQDKQWLFKKRKQIRPLSFNILSQTAPAVAVRMRWTQFCRMLHLSLVMTSSENLSLKLAESLFNIQRAV